MRSGFESHSLYINNNNMSVKIMKKNYEISKESIDDAFRKNKKKRLTEFSQEIIKYRNFIKGKISMLKKPGEFRDSLMERSNSMLDLLDYCNALNKRIKIKPQVNKTILLYVKTNRLYKKHGK